MAQSANANAHWLSYGLCVAVFPRLGGGLASFANGTLREHTVNESCHSRIDSPLRCQRARSRNARGLDPSRRKALSGGGSALGRWRACGRACTLRGCGDVASRRTCAALLTRLHLRMRPPSKYAAPRPDTPSRPHCSCAIAGCGCASRRPLAVSHSRSAVGLSSSAIVVSPRQRAARGPPESPGPTPSGRVLSSDPLPPACARSGASARGSE